MKAGRGRKERERAKAIAVAARNRSAFLRIQMVKIALRRNGCEESVVPSLAKQLLFYSAPSWFSQNEGASIENAIAMARKFIAAALSNVYVQRAIEQKLTTIAAIHEHTPVALEFEHAVSVADLGTCVSCSGTKNSFGRCIGIRPLDKDTPCDHERILYLYRSSSPYNRRVDQRAYLKRRLKEHRKFVSLAMRKSKREFLADHSDVAEIIEHLFKIPMGRFWRIARGKEFIEIPKEPVQLLLTFEYAD